MYRHGRIMEVKTYTTGTWDPWLWGGMLRTLSPLDRFLGLPYLVRCFLKHALEMLNRIYIYIDVRLGSIDPSSSISS